MTEAQDEAVGTAPGDERLRRISPLRRILGRPELGAATESDPGKERLFSGVPSDFCCRLERRPYTKGP